jgi:hypothetical protein
MSAFGLSRHERERCKYPLMTQSGLGPVLTERPSLKVAGFARLRSIDALAELALALKWGDVT